MLVLKLDFEDGLFIGSDIRIKVVPDGGRSVKLLIEAPKEIPIFRQKALRKMLGLEAFESLVRAFGERRERKARPNVPRADRNNRHAGMANKPL